MSRTAIATEPRCRKALTRKRLNPWIVWEKSTSPFCSKKVWRSLGAIDSNNRNVSAVPSGGRAKRTRAPLIRSVGGTPTVR